MLLLLKIPEPEYRMSKLYVEVTSAESIGMRTFIYSLNILYTDVIYLKAKNNSDKEAPELESVPALCREIPNNESHLNVSLNLLF